MVIKTLIAFFFMCGVAHASADMEKREAWKSFWAQDYNQMYDRAKVCIQISRAAGADRIKSRFVSSEQAFHDYKKYMTEGDFAECYYLKGLAEERMGNCNAILSYESILTLYPTVWTGWPGTPWQPSRMAQEAIDRIGDKCLFWDGEGPKPEWVK